MKLSFDTGNRHYILDSARGLSLAIPLRFDGLQPNFFAAPPAVAAAFEADGFVGDTRRGGSCNVGRYDFVPHCNGTHTECIAHVVDDAPPLPEHLRPGLLAATLATVAPRHNVIDAAVIKMALQHHPLKEFHQALILRTLPNGKDKLARRYDTGALPPYMDAEAVALLTAGGVEHLLVDLPSLDPMHDAGRMAAHRAFWGLPEGSRRYADAKRPHGTVTEMIYAADNVADGYYVLDLQIPAFMSDAAPSRPVLYPLESK